jgi:hypothetical protein
MHRVRQNLLTYSLSFHCSILPGNSTGTRIATIRCRRAYETKQSSFKSGVGHIRLVLAAWDTAALLPSEAFPVDDAGVDGSVWAPLSRHL